MTRPNIIRADTLDLQSTTAPSAKDHSRQPSHPASFGDDPPPPYQALVPTQAEQDVEFHPRSPRMSQDLSNKELQLLHDDNESIDSTNGTGSDHGLQGLHRNGGPNGGMGEASDGEDGSGDDGSEDDMMDKISSSPSIEDGGYSLPLHPPRHSDSPNSLLSSSAVVTSSVGFPLSANDEIHLPDHGPFSVYHSLSQPSSSSFSSCQEHLDNIPSEGHHQKGEYSEDRHILKNGNSGVATDEWTTPPLSPDRNEFENVALYDSDSDTASLDAAELHQLLVPENDSILDNSFDDAPLWPSVIESPSSSPIADSPPLGMAFQWEDQSLDETDDDSEDFSYSDDSRFIDSGWGGECLRETEDIDFDFVYALHTFIATVEGQANATKGDTMVLLDDTNSYWWLVRVVKDGSIGYLPAEHIETPTERLARLNKHRNIDLSQPMLGDSPEKSKNPLKKAMRRRNAKTVQFAPPTFFEPPHAEYSTEDEGESDAEYNIHPEENTDLRDGDQDVESNEVATVEPSNPRTQGNDVAVLDEVQGSGDSQGGDEQRTTIDSERTSDENLERSDDASAAGRSRKGTLRNTDSFFKDDNMETRKINLTPSLLRDDSSGSTVKSTDGKEQYTRGSLDSLEKPQSSERGKEDKKRKEKKGMLGGLFKRKDKKSKGHEDDMEDRKQSLEETPRESPQPKESSESWSQENQQSPQSPQRQASKLQKTPPAKLSSAVNTSTSRVEPPSSVSTRPEPQQYVIPPPSRAAPSIEVDDTGVQSTSRVESGYANTNMSASQVQSGIGVRPEETVDVESHYASQRGIFPSATHIVPPSSRSDPTPEPLKAPQHRMVLDEFDSSSEPDERPDHSLLQNSSSQHRPPPADSKERLSESPVDVAPPDQLQMHHPPDLVIDTSSQEDPTISPSPSSSAELIEAPRSGKEREATPASTTQSSSTTTTTNTWNDASLRAYLENDTDIRDLLTLVKDKSDMKPPSRDHPLVKNLFKDENQKLADMSKELDGLLDDFIARRPKAKRDKSLRSISPT